MGVHRRWRAIHCEYRSRAPWCSLQSVITRKVLGNQRTSARSLAQPICGCARRALASVVFSVCPRVTRLRAQREGTRVPPIPIPIDASFALDSAPPALIVQYGNKCWWPRAPIISMSRAHRIASTDCAAVTLPRLPDAVDLRVVWRNFRGHTTPSITRTIKSLHYGLPYHNKDRAPSSILVTMVKIYVTKIDQNHKEFESCSYNSVKYKIYRMKFYKLIIFLKIKSLAKNN